MIVYANYNYLLIKPKTHKIKNLSNICKQLHNIYPKYIHSHLNYHLILDLYNNIHIIVMTKNYNSTWIPGGNQFVDFTFHENIVYFKGKNQIISEFEIYTDGRLEITINKYKKSTASVVTKIIVLSWKENKLISKIETIGSMFYVNNNVFLENGDMLVDIYDDTYIHNSWIYFKIPDTFSNVRLDCNVSLAQYVEKNVLCEGHVFNDGSMTTWTRQIMDLNNIKDYYYNFSSVWYVDNNNMSFIIDSSGKKTQCGLVKDNYIKVYLKYSYILYLVYDDNIIVFDMDKHGARHDIKSEKFIDKLGGNCMFVLANHSGLEPQVVPSKFSIFPAQLDISHLHMISLKDFAWSPNTHRFVTDHNKVIIYNFMLCNRLKGIHKVPKGVFSIIFNYLIV